LRAFEWQTNNYRAVFKGYQSLATPFIVKGVAHANRAMRPGFPSPRGIPRGIPSWHYTSRQGKSWSYMSEKDDDEMWNSDSQLVILSELFRGMKSLRQNERSRYFEDGHASGSEAPRVFFVLFLKRRRDIFFASQVSRGGPRPPVVRRLWTQEGRYCGIRKGACILARRDCRPVLAIER
jgi:hypothetical protein